MTRNRTNWPSVPGSSKSPDHGGGRTRQRTEGAKNPRVLPGHHGQRLLHIATYNTRTLASDEQILELEKELERIKWDIVGISETRRKGENQLTLKSGNLFYHAGEESSLRGVGFLIHKKYAKKVLDIKCVSPRVIYMILGLNQKYSLKIIQAYAPTTGRPDEEAENFYEDVSRAMSENKTHYMMLMGDFNAKTGCKKDEAETALGNHGIGVRNDRGEMLVQFLLQHNLYVINTFFKKKANRKWTWASPDGRTKNEVDFIISNRKDIFQDINVLNRFSTGSDHRMVRAKIKINLKREREKLIFHKKRNKRVPPGDTYKYREEIEHSLNYDANQSVDDLNENIVSSIKNALEGNRTQQGKEGIFNKHILKLMKQRREMTRKNNEEYRKISREITKEIRKNKRQQNNEMIAEVIEENKSLKVLRRKMALGKKEMTRIKDKNGNIVTNKKEILKVTEDFYRELYKQQQENTSPSFPIKVINQGSEDIPDITEEEIRGALNEMKNNKAPGEDDLVIEAIKSAGEPVTKALGLLFNKCLAEGITPSQWSNAIIITMHKKGDPTDLGNYRPISLLTHIYKIFTKILTKRLTNKLIFYQPKEQAGFRPGFGTNDHLLSIKVLIEKCIEYNKPLILIFVDYEKAFDSVNQRRMLEALSECRIDYRYTTLIKHIYNKATASVRLHEDTKKFRIEKGVRQGDTLSPLLFITLLESMCKKINWESMGINIDGEKISHLRFADDIVLISEDVREAQNMLNILNKKSEEIGLKINTGKTQFMTNLVLSRNITLNDNYLQQVSTYKYLGHEICIGRDNQTLEIQRRIGLTWAAFGNLRNIFKSDLPNCLKRKVFDQCVLPVLTYGAETLTLTKKSIEKIQVAQRRMERSMLGITLRDRVPNKTIRQKSGVRDAVETILKLKWNWAGHVARMTDNRWTKRLLEWRPRIEAKRSRGRPPTRWTDNLKRVADNWMQTAHDRTQWNSFREAFVQQWTA